MELIMANSLKYIKSLFSFKITKSYNRLESVKVGQLDLTFSPMKYKNNYENYNFHKFDVLAV